MQETHYTMPDCPACIALVTDLHERPADLVVASLRKHRPDLIAIAGDLFHKLDTVARINTKQNCAVLKFLATCATIAPTCLSIGNHDAILCSDDSTRIAEAGCIVLDNSWQRIDGLVVAGLSSALIRPAAGDQCHGSEGWSQNQGSRALRYIWRSRHRASSPDTHWMQDYSAVEGYHILLCHHPEYWSLVREYPIDLMLSGHAHGGQWRYYSLRSKRWEGVFAPGQGLFPKLTAGVHEERLVISRGLANTAPIPRFFNPREIVYVN